MARLIHMLLCVFESLTSNITQIDPSVTSVSTYYTHFLILSPCIMHLLSYGSLSPLCHGLQGGPD